MSTVVVEGILTGTRPIPAYGGVQLDEKVLHQLVEQLLSGDMPMLLSHDPRRPLEAKILEAEVRMMPDGHKEVWFRFEVDEKQWKAFTDEAAQMGAPGGFSFSCSEPLATLEAYEGAPPGYVVELAADASHWSDDDLLAAAEELRRVGRVEVGRRYEFAVGPAAVVVLYVVLPLVITVVGNAIYDSLRHFLRPERQTIFHFRVSRRDGIAEGHLETSDQDVLMRGIQAFEDLGQPGRRFEWDDESGKWRPLDP